MRKRKTKTDAEKLSAMKRDAAVLIRDLSLLSSADKTWLLNSVGWANSPSQVQAVLSLIKLMHSR